MPESAELPKCGSEEGVLPCLFCVVGSLCLTCIGMGDEVLGGVSSSCSSTSLSSAWEIGAMMMKQLVLLQECTNGGCSDDELSQFVTNLDK